MKAIIFPQFKSEMGSCCDGLYPVLKCIFVRCGELAAAVAAHVVFGSRKTPIEARWAAAVAAHVGFGGENLVNINANNC